jgi:hypothetical protein
MAALPFHRSVLESIRRGDIDGLCLLAQGLGLDTVLYHLTRQYCVVGVKQKSGCVCVLVCVCIVYVV